MYDFLIMGLLAVLILYQLITEKRIGTKAETAVYAVCAVFYILRFHQGNDIGSYAQIFNYATAALIDKEHPHLMRNLLFSRYAWISKILFKEFRWMILLTNIIVFGLVSWTVFKHSRNILLSLMLFIGTGFLEVYYGSGLRQAIAMALLLFSFYEFLPKKQYLLFELFCLIGFGFHELAVAAMPLPLLLKLVPHFKKHPIKMMAAGAVLSFLMFIIMDNFATPFSYWVTDRYGFAPAWTHGIVYLRIKEFSILGFGMECVFLIGMTVMFSLADRSQMTDFEYFEVIVFFFSIMLYIMLADYSLMSRITDYLQVIMLVLIPNMLCKIPVRRYSTAVFALLFLLSSLLLYADLNAKISAVEKQTFKEYSLETYPYITVFEKERIHNYIILIS